MYVATKPKTYRVSEEVDVELKRLAEIHGGVDRALRVVFGWGSPLDSQVGIKALSVEAVARQRNSEFRGPLLRPGEK